jgi:hypothetical protein
MDHRKLVAALLDAGLPASGLSLLTAVGAQMACHTATQRPIVAGASQWHTHGPVVAAIWATMARGGCGAVLQIRLPSALPFRPQPACVRHWHWLAWLPGLWACGRQP